MPVSWLDPVEFYRTLPDCVDATEERAEVDVAALSEFLGAIPDNAHPKRLLDVGCGRGMHLVRWLQRGFRVAGIDAVASLLQEAGLRLRKHAQESAQHERVMLYRADVRDEGAMAALPQHFDFLVAHQNFFHHLKREDIHTVLRSLRMITRPHGRLAFDWTLVGDSGPRAYWPGIHMTDRGGPCTITFDKEKHVFIRQWEIEGITVAEAFHIHSADDLHDAACRAGWRVVDDQPTRTADPTIDPRRVLVLENSGLIAGRSVSGQ